jgi:TP901 family phage tail tape measure protein
VRTIANNIKGITVEINGETGPLDKALKGVNKSSIDLKNELKEVEKGLRLDPTNTNLLAQRQTLLAQSITNTKEKLETLKAAEEQAQAKFAEGEISEQQYRALQREVINTAGELSNLEARAEESNTTLDKVSETVEKIGAAGDKMKDVGKSMSVGVTAPILAFGAAGVAAFNSVDEALDTIITKTGATGDSSEALADSFEEVAGRVPDDLTTVGEAIGEVNTQFGFMDKELEDSSQLMLEFASINGTDVTASSIASKQAIEAYGLANSDLNSVLDSVTKTAQDTGQSVDFLFEKATSGAPQIKALGLTFAEGTALIGNFEKSGVDSSASLSSLSKAQVGFAKDGKTLQQGLSETIDKIKNASSETDALTAASEVFGTKGASRMVDAIKRGTFSLGDFADAGKNASGAVQDTFNETVDPIDQAAIAMNNAKLAMAKVGDAIQIALLPVMEKVTELLGRLADWFKSLSPEMMNTILVVLGLVAAIGPLLVVFGAIASAIGSMLALFGTISGAIAVLTTGAAAATPAVGALAAVMGFIISPVGLVIIAIVALVAIFVLAYKNIEGFRNIVDAAWSFIKNKTKQIFEGYIMPFIRDQLMPLFQKVFSTIKDVVTGTFIAMGWAWDNILKPIFTVLMWYINNVLLPGWKLVFSAISGAVKSVFSTIGSLWNNSLKPILNGILDFISGVFTGNWSKAWGGIVGIFKGIWEGMKTIAKAPINFIIGGLNGFIKGINKIKIPDWVPGLGGKGFSIPSIPSFSVGTKFLPKDMLIQAHQGEMIVPKSENPYANSGNGNILPGESQVAKQPIILQTVLNGRVIAEETYSDISRLISSANKLGARSKGVVML